MLTTFCRPPRPPLLACRIDLGISSGDDVGSETPAKSARVRELVAAENYDALLEADQLKHAQRHGSALVGFREAPIHFQPTFKVDRKPGFHHKASLAAVVTGATITL